MTTYRIHYTFGGHDDFDADLSQAAAPVTYPGEDGEQYSTPYQTADGCHCEHELARLLVEYWGEDVTIDSVEAIDEDEGDDDGIEDMGCVEWD